MPPKSTPETPKTPPGQVFGSTSGPLPRSPPKTTPVKAQADTLHTYGFTALNAADFRGKYANEAVGMFVGPMPVKDFFNAFLPHEPPGALAGRRSSPASFKNVPARSTVEADLYEPLVNELNKCCPGFKFFVSASRGDTDIKIRPDIGMLDLSHRPNSGTSQPAGETVFDWARCELSCEVKREKNVDPFDDKNPNTVENAGELARSHRGQLLTYYKAQASRQHRTFVFQIFIRGPFARFLRWDRSGAVVSASFDYQRDPDVLAGFVRRYIHLIPSQRGWDSTKTLAAPKERSTFKAKIQEFLNAENIRGALVTSRSARSSGPNFLPVLSPQKHATSASAPTPAPPIQKADRLIFDSENILEGDYPTYQIQLARISGSDSNSSKPSKKQTRATHNQATSTLIFRRPIYEPLSPFGRATRGYFAYDKVDDMMVFLKDTWRFVHPNPKRQSEGAICQWLQSLGIRLVPTVLAHGDFQDDCGSQKTLTDTLLRQSLPWRRKCTELRAHVHHYVVQEVLYPLTSFRNSRELVKICMDVIDTIFVAHDKAGILHRDISIGNVMINANGEGVLGDWDNYGFVRADNTKHAPFRTGTWQFMSIDLLYGKTCNQLRHDVESASLWVPLYMALHFLAHNQPHFGMSYLFDHVKPGDGISPATGGHHKENFLIREDWDDLEFGCRPLNDLFRGLFRDWTVLYQSYGVRRIYKQAGLDYQNKLAELTNRDYVVGKFKTALTSDGWPEDDVLADQFPRMTEAQQALRDEATTRGQLTLGDPAAGASAALGNDAARPNHIPLRDGSESSLTNWSYDSDDIPHLRESADVPRTPIRVPRQGPQSQTSSDIDDQPSPSARFGGKGKSVLRRDQPSPTPGQRRPTAAVGKIAQPVATNSNRSAPPRAGPSNAPGTAVAAADTQKRKISQVGSTHSPKGEQKKQKQKQKQKRKKTNGKAKALPKRR